MSVARIETLKSAARQEREHARECREAVAAIGRHAAQHANGPTVVLLKQKAAAAAMRAARMEAEAEILASIEFRGVPDRPSPQERIRHAESRLGALDRFGRETRHRVSKAEERLARAEIRLTALEKRGETTVKPDPDTVTDGEGDLWTRDRNGLYYLGDTGPDRLGYRTLDSIREKYGLR